MWGTLRFQYRMKAAFAVNGFTAGDGAAAVPAPAAAALCGRRSTRRRRTARGGGGGGAIGGFGDGDGDKKPWE